MVDSLILKVVNSVLVLVSVCLLECNISVSVYFDIPFQDYCYRQNNFTILSRYQVFIGYHMDQPLTA